LQVLTNFPELDGEEENSSVLDLFIGDNKASGGEVLRIDGLTDSYNIFVLKNERDVK